MNIITKDLENEKIDDLNVISISLQENKVVIKNG